MKKISLFLALWTVAALACFGAKEILLLPSPKYMVYTLEGQDSAYCHASFSFEGTPAAKYEELTEEFREYEGTSRGGELNVGCTLFKNKPEIKNVVKRCGLSLSIADSLGRQGFIVVWKASRVDIFALGERGVQYGLEAVKQIVRNRCRPRALVIADWPDLSRRVFFDDISRGPIPTVAALKREIRQLAELRYTALSFYIEHVVKTAAYPDFAPADGKLTIADIREICGYARKYQIEVIGSFQCFGHFESVLANPKYAPMGETPSMISPLDAGARIFLKRNLEELCDAFSSEYFNINCDETWDLDKGRNQDYARRVGAAKFYADHIKFLYGVLKGKGKKTMMWGDMAMKYPEIIDSLPSDIVYLTWNYDGTDYEPWIAPFALRHRRFVVCPGIVNSNRLMPDYAAVSENMQFIADGFRNSAFGAMLTEWDDSCVHSFASYALGVAMAAEAMWNASRQSSAVKFRRAYCANRFGTYETNYFKTIDKLTQLSDLPMTFQMNSRILTEVVVPDKGKSLNVDARDLRKMRAILRDADSLCQTIRFARNSQDIASLRYVIDVYRFALAFKDVALKASSCYHDTVPGSEKRKQLVSCLDETAELKTMLQSVVCQYTSLWFAENQYYTYGHTLSILKNREIELSRMESDLSNAIKLIDSGMMLVPAIETCLNVKAVNSNYFDAWLVCGPYEDGELNVDYLSEVGGEQFSIPQPGLRFQYSGAGYKWTRKVSADAFALDLGDVLNSNGNAVGYASVEIICSKDTVVTLLFGGSGENILLLNGHQVFKSKRGDAFVADQYSLELPLKSGVNRLIVKSRQLVREWRISARIDGVAVKGHKQKYYLGD